MVISDRSTRVCVLHERIGEEKESFRPVVQPGLIFEGIVNLEKISIFCRCLVGIRK
jgi:hypothetical protein